MCMCVCELMKLILIPLIIMMSDDDNELFVAVLLVRFVLTALQSSWLSCSRCFFFALTAYYGTANGALINEYTIYLCVCMCFCISLCCYY